MAEENRVGEKIRQVRENKGMSREELAQACQSSVELIERLENGAYVPSLAPLLKIARAMGVRLGTFLDDLPQTGPFVVKSGYSDNVIHFSPSDSNFQESELDIYSLAYGKGDRHMEPFVVEVHPKKAEDHVLSPHEGEEFVYVLQGSIEILYGQENYQLSAGDSIYYDSVVPHHLHASGEKEARILAVIYTP